MTHCVSRLTFRPKSLVPDRIERRLAMGVYLFSGKVRSGGKTMSAHGKPIVSLVVRVDRFLRSAMAVRVPGRRVGIMTGS
jgi:hypothetical protein